MSARGLFRLVVLGWLAAAAPAGAGILNVQPLGGGSGRDLANAIVGCGIEVTDIHYTGAPGSAGFFSTTVTGLIGFDSGIILTTGAASNAIGPNNASGASVDVSRPGDADLTALAGVPTFDACVLDFKFIPSSTSVTFEYVFASEEYNEFVFAFNDVFAFFLNGVNLALIPGTSTPVSINTVNEGSPIGTGAVNPSYYLCNDGGSMPVSCSAYGDPTWDAVRFNALQYDGLTVVFTVTATVVAGQINEMKMAIADGSDHLYDSAVFIKAGSFGSPCPPFVPSPPGPVANLAGGLSAFPNPYRPGTGGSQDAAAVTIHPVPPGGTVRIYDGAGRPVVELTEGGGGQVLWDGRNKAGRAVASGVYAVVATPRGGGTPTRTKLVVVR